MIAGRADAANVNDLVTVRPLTRPGTSPRWVAEQTFGVWLGWGAVKRKTAPPATNATQGSRDAAAERDRGRAGGKAGVRFFRLTAPWRLRLLLRPCSATHRRRFSMGETAQQPAALSTRQPIPGVASLRVNPERIERMWQMTAQQRVEAAQQGQFTLGEMLRWASTPADARSRSVATASGSSSASSAPTRARPRARATRRARWRRPPATRRAGGPGDAAPRDAGDRHRRRLGCHRQRPLRPRLGRAGRRAPRARHREPRPAADRDRPVRRRRRVLLRLQAGRLARDRRQRVRRRRRPHLPVQPRLAPHPDRVLHPRGRGPLDPRSQAA